VKINWEYAAQGVLVWNTARVVPELIESGVRVLAYAGDTDMVCNFMGVEAFIGGLSTSYAEEFAAAKPKAWTVGNGTAGYVRAAGGNGSTAGNQTFVVVHEAGSVSNYNVYGPCSRLPRSHRDMSLLDQPEATLVRGSFALLDVSVDDIIRTCFSNGSMTSRSRHSAKPPRETPLSSPQDQMLKR
jgi:hypothetical protein